MNNKNSILIRSMSLTLKRLFRPASAAFAAVISLLLSGCGRLGTIPMSPETTPGEWLGKYPHSNMNIFSRDFILAEPSSSAIVYLLAVVTIAAGIRFLKTRGNHRSKFWWGTALILWGIGTLLAGTSYQAFAYEIKCAGKALCSWTSWFEVYYMIFEVASVNAIVTAVAWSTLEEKHARAAGLYAIINFTAYCAVSLAGAFLPSWFLVSFELMTLFCIPGFIVAFILNVRAYRRDRDAMNRNLIVTWMSLFLIMVAYYGYLLAGLTKKLWAHGIWFSANDVLHVGLILWMLYIAFAVAGKVTDRRADNSSV